MPKKKNTLDLQGKMREAGLNPKTEFLFLGFVIILCIGGFLFMYFYMKQPIPSFALLFVALIFVYLTFTKASRIKKKENADLEKEFVRIFAYFSIFIKNGIPVYHALEETLPYCSPKMNEYLRELISNIDKDKSVRPYISFAERFSALEIRQVMVSIYKMVDNGGSEAYLRQFTTIFDSLANDRYIEEIHHEESSFGTLCMAPMLDSGLLMILITAGVVSLLGGVINGI
ncbi:MAG: hypothetical protein K5694_01585 [Bacilli bacterium]|nr:hypothetical protein [Bacilli bacterium]